MTKDQLIAALKDTAGDTEIFIEESVEGVPIEIAELDTGEDGDCALLRPRRALTLAD